MLPNSADSFEKFRKLIKVSRRLVRTSVAWFLENSFRPKAAGKEMEMGEFKKYKYFGLMYIFADSFQKSFLCMQKQTCLP